MREYVPRPLRVLLSPLRRRASRLRGRILRRMMRGAGRVDDYRYVFVVTYGRSGSTLLMSLLNAIPGYRICGENYNALYRLYQADAAVGAARERFCGTSELAPQSSWYGMPRVRPHRFRAELVDSFVNHVLRPEPGDRVLGFKEIRYTPGHVPDLAEYLRFLHDCFPYTKVVFNHRDPAAVARSAWWARYPNAEETVREADERLRSVPADHRHFHFCYDEIDDSLANIAELFRFLGEEFDEMSVRAVLGKAHSPYPVTASGGKR
jgi:Sulfotransferase family